MSDWLAPIHQLARAPARAQHAERGRLDRYGVMQWPHRRLRSLEKKIASLKAEQRYTVDGQVW